MLLGRDIRRISIMDFSKSFYGAVNPIFNSPRNGSVPLRAVIKDLRPRQGSVVDTCDELTMVSPDPSPTNLITHVKAGNILQTLWRISQPAVVNFKRFTILHFTGRGDISRGFLTGMQRQSSQAAHHLNSRSDCRRNEIRVYLSSRAASFTELVLDMCFDAHRERLLHSALNRTASGKSQMFRPQSFPAL